MPPVLNTYGVKKKKRGRLPKFIFEEAPETDDVFESLNIENIKETKALLEEKGKLKTKKKETVRKPFYSWGCSNDADTTFDKLLQDGPTHSRWSRPDSSSSSNDSGSFDFKSVAQKKIIGKKNTARTVKTVVKSRKASEGRGRKPSRKSEDNSFVTKINQNAAKPMMEMSGDLEGSFFTMKNVKNVSKEAIRQPENGCKKCNEASTPVLSKRTKKQLEALSPILPINLTSTPHGNTFGNQLEVPLVFRSLPSDTACKLNGSATDRKSVNVSVDLFASYEHQENRNPIILDEALCEDLFSSRSKANILTVSSSCHVVSLSENCSLSPESGCEDSKSKRLLSTATATQSCIASDEVMESAHERDVFCEQGTANSLNMSNSFKVYHEECANNLSRNCSHSPLGECEDSRCRSPLSKQIDSQSWAVLDGTAHVCDDVSHVNVIDIADSDTSGLGPIVKDKTSSIQREVYSEEEAIVSSNISDLSIRDCVVMLSRCDLVEQPVHDVDALPMDTSNSQDRTADLNLSQDSSYVDVIFSSHQASPNISPLKACEVVLHRCDVEPFDRPPCPVETANCTSSSCLELETLPSDVGSGHEPKNNPRVPFECKITLSRCDDTVSMACKTVANTECSSSVMASPSGSLTPGVNCESFVGVMCGRPSQDMRHSLTPEPLVLKPGKHWRRSLSILSKIRTSSGEPSCRKSLALNEGKIRGKRWESSVNSLIQLQPNRETILEDFEASVSSCHLDVTQEKDITLSKDDDSVIVCESPSRTGELSSSSEVLRRCGQEKPLPFIECYPSSMKEQCKKIGEGVYGEVFLYSGDSVSVIKIIPIEGEMEVNGEPQKTFKEIFSEVCIAQELSDLRKGTDNVTRTFNEVQAIRCVKGSYPVWLQELWHNFNDTKGSENDCPDIFGEDQLFIVLELRHGGQDLESFVFSSADQGLAAFKQIALTVAVGEAALNFEHRDLHWGNVLLTSTKTKTVDFMLNGVGQNVLSKGVEVSIIDFTLSRISNPNTGSAVYYDLSQDETLFTAQGDYQFDIYRMMKDYCGNKWDCFTPKTNIAWLHYLLDKFCTMVRYRNRTSKVHANALVKLNEMKNTVLKFNDVVSFVNCPDFCK